MTIMYCYGETTNMSTDQVNTCFIFRHTEADTILLSIYARLQDNGHTEVAVIDSEDGCVCPSSIRFTSSLWRPSHQAKKYICKLSKHAVGGYFKYHSTSSCDQWQ